MSIGASTRWVLAHRRLVMVAWLLVAVVGLATGGKATGALSRQNTLPGQPAYQANLAIARRYSGGVNPIVPVVTLPAGTTVDSPGVRAQLARVFGRATAAVPGARVASLVSTGDRAFVSADGRTTFALLYPPVGSGLDATSPAIDAVQAALAGARVAGAPVHVTSLDALSDTGSGGNGPGVLAMTLLGAAGALLVLAFVFGLSMDYEVFILARMREEYDSSGSTTAAIVRGIGRTGRLVTSAALILFLAFVSLASGPETQVKVVATGLAAGILLDATVVRMLLVPALVSLMSRWNWWLPGAFARLLRVPAAASTAEALR